MFHLSRAILIIIPLFFFGFGCGEKGTTNNPTCEDLECPENASCVMNGEEPTCGCNEGYSGEECDRCAEGYEPDDDGRCVITGPCAGDPCNGHGTCDDSTGEAVCTCETGYTGVFCESCDVGYHDDGTFNCVPDEHCTATTCDGHGDCDDSTGEVGCSCHEGYTGEYCETCEDGFHRDEKENCVADEYCIKTDPCGENGTCEDSTGVIECLCNEGYSGEYCGECSAGYHDDGAGNCVIDEQCMANTCSGQGTCDDSTGVVSCSCDVGYNGDHCENCLDGYHRDTESRCVIDEDCETEDPCNERGTCAVEAGLIKCVCELGYDGFTCAQCAAGYHDDGFGMCVLDHTCLPSSCSAHGTCEDTEGAVTCACETGYDGAFCESCASGFHRDNEENCIEDESCELDDPCGDYGTCVNTTGVIDCICDLGYDGATCADCHPGYHDDGSGACVIDVDCRPTSCSGNGDCDDTSGPVSCSCQSGYGGPFCKFCDLGFHRNAEGICVVNENCVPEESCSTSGTCIDTTGVVECVCNIGYDGVTCADCHPGYHNVGPDLCVLDETCQPESCSGNGTCDDTTGVVSCECEVGYDGVYCESCAIGYHNCSGQCLPNDSLDSCGDRCEPCPTDPNGTASCDGTACSLTCDDGWFWWGGACHSFCTTTIESSGTVGLFTSLALDSLDRPHISYNFQDSLGDALRYATFADTEWTIETVGSEPNVGEHTSIALDSSDLPHVSYYDTADSELKYARFTGTEWLIETVDGDGTVGTYTSIALDSTGLPHISYFDDTNDVLKYARFTGGEWIIETVDSEGWVGQHTSLALDSMDRPHISYFDATNRDLKYARLSDTGWITLTADSFRSVGEYTSIALDSSDLPHITYYDITNDDLKYAIYTGRSWFIETVDSAGLVGQHTSLTLDSSELPHVSYRDGTNGDLKYAHFTGDEWIIETVDSEGNVGWLTSLTLSSGGQPHISYYDFSNEDLKYAWLSTDDTCSL